MAALSRDMGALASGMSKGIQLGQEYNANEQAQALRQKQLDEMARQEGIRAQIGALDRSDPTQWAEGVHKVRAGAGDFEGAMAAQGQADTMKKQAKMSQLGSFAAAVASGQIDQAKALVPKMGLFGGRPTNLAGVDPKSGKLIFEVADPQSGRRTRQAVHPDQLIGGSWIDIDANKGMENYFRQQQSREELSARSADRAALRGANDRWEVAYLGGKDGKSTATPMQIQRTASGIYGYDDATKKTRRLSNAEVAMLRPEPSGGKAAYGPNESLAREALGRKQYENSASPEAAIQSESSILQQARMKDAAEIIRREAPGGTLSFSYAAELLRGGATPEMLLAAGFHPDTIPTGAGALQR